MLQGIHRVDVGLQESELFAKHTRPNEKWVADFERHEAFLNPAVMKGHRRVLVAAGAMKLRAA